MPLLRQMAQAYLHHRLSSAPPHRSAEPHRPGTTEEAPLRWMRDFGLDLSGRRGEQGVRASDADREHVVDFLKRHAAEGRLSTEELDWRVEAAYSGVSLAQLDRLTADLPGSPLAAETTPARRSGLAGPAAHLAAIGVALMVLVALLGVLIPAEVWAPLLMLFVPLGAFALISILPFALPVLALLLLAGAGRRRALHGGHHHQSLLPGGRRGNVHVWRL